MQAVLLEIMIRHQIVKEISISYCMMKMLKVPIRDVIV